MRRSILLVLAGLARAAAAEPCPCAPPPPQALTEARDGGRDPAAATVLALGGATVSIVGLAVALDERNTAGVVAGIASAALLPSAGHWYGGTLVTPGMGLRLVGAAVTTYGVLHLISAERAAEYDDNPPPHDHLGAIALVGVATWGTGVVYDLVTAHRAVRRWNARHATQLQPTVLRTAGGYGVGLTARF